MALAQEDFNSIDAYIREHLSEWLADKSISRRSLDYEIEIRERIVRVEEELKHQRELMMQGFEMMDKRIMELREDMNMRFVLVDKRFEELREDMNKRFEQVDKRFEQVDKRFEQVDKRFEEMRQDMNTRFEVLTKRLDRFMIWSFGLMVTLSGVIIAILKL